MSSLAHEQKRHIYEHRQTNPHLDRKEPALTERFFQVADAWLGAERVVRVEHLTMGAEDFSYYTQKVPSVFFCLGLKDPEKKDRLILHHPAFDFNDEAIPTGIEMLCRLATME